MNYIKNLELQLEVNTLTRDDLLRMITEFLMYLESNKFWVDTTIQVSEVQELLMKMRLRLL